MGQCLSCTRTDTASTDAMEEKESLTLPTESSGKSLDQSPRQSGIDSAPDSGHSSGDDASCCGGGSGGSGVGDGAGGVVPPAAEAQGRNSHSSESSGKYSMRGSIGSCGECDRSHLFPARIDECSIDMPVFEEKGQLGDDDDDGGVFTHDSLHPLQDVTTRPRKVSRGSSRGSRGSSSSERGSFSSVTSVTAILKARLGRSSSLSVQRDMPEAEVLSTSSYVASDAERPHRTVSLRLPRSHRRPHDSDTNLPTIYVDDSPQQQTGRRRERKSSLQRALSLLSMNSFLRHQATSSSSSSSKKAQKPVQKILRQPRRRHDTVRGLSGLAIDRTNQGISYSGLQRAHTLYYPTATSLRYASTARRTKSTTT